VRLAAVLALALMVGVSSVRAEDIAAFVVTGDTIPAPLRGLAGEAARGALVVRNREAGNCLICHTIPDPKETFQGNLAPLLAGVGSRLTPGQIRLRLVDPTLVNGAAIMPAYYRVAGFVNVDPRHANQPVLGAQEIEDAVAYLSGLKE
jgi:L-cysteine S-thiosulfotransferase